MAIIKLIFMFFLTFTQIMTPVAQIAFNGGEKKFFEQWSAEQVFTDDYAVVLEKQADKDFVILNLTDIQLSDNELYGDYGNYTFTTIKKLIQQTNPDLITVTGDNAWSTVSYVEVANKLDSYGIPWAPVMGNHDGQGTGGELWCAKVLDNCKNCLFKFGPADMGYGNYIINIKENGKIIHTLFMMDTHSGVESDGINGAKDSGYDHLWANQIEWYKWAVEGIKALNGGETVQSSVYFHIPLVEYRTAWNEAFDTQNGCYNPEYADTAFGINEEDLCHAPANNGFFAVLKAYDSTKDVVCGHDHVNSASIVYDGIRLTYGLKTGPACYWNQEMSGGTTLTLASDGSLSTQHVYIKLGATSSSSIC